MSYDGTHTDKGSYNNAITLGGANKCAIQSTNSNMLSILFTDVRLYRFSNDNTKPLFNAYFPTNTQPQHLYLDISDNTNSYNGTEYILTFKLCFADSHH
mmetsp:Transcript_25063/g.34979  ORF Transcript_25063/g.34979 Transcript_25063/m.34979 type:complete len:99 (-) Transcript_25063:769-1065(-)